MGAHPKKISGAKNMQNLARFRTTSKFGGEYLRNGWRYSKSDFSSIYRDSSCVRRNKSGELWSSNLGDLDVNSYSYPPKAHFSEEHISAPIGAIYDNFRVWAQIYLELIKIATKFKRRWRKRSFGRWTKKFCEIRSTTNKVISAYVDLP